MKSANQGEFERYHRMPKDFVGSSEADALFRIADHLSLRLSPGYLLAAGSAAIESSIIATEASQAEQHFRLDCAELMWNGAQTAYQEQHRYGSNADSLPGVFIDRVTAHKLYLPLYRDIVNGNVRAVTVERTHDRLPIGGR